MSDALERMAAAAVQAIVDDLTDRRGLKQQWYEIDDEIQAEIMQSWKQKIIEAARATPGETTVQEAK